MLFPVKLQIQDLTDEKLVQERTDLKAISTTAVIKDIRHSIEVLLSIKNDQNQTQQTAQNMDTSLMHEESLLGLSAHNPYGSPGSTNPFDKANHILASGKDRNQSKNQ